MRDGSVMNVTILPHATAAPMILFARKLVVTIALIALANVMIVTYA